MHTLAHACVRARVRRLPHSTHVSAWSAKAAVHRRQMGMANFPNGKTSSFWQNLPIGRIFLRMLGERWRPRLTQGVLTREHVNRVAKRRGSYKGRPAY